MYDDSLISPPWPPLEPPRSIIYKNRLPAVRKLYASLLLFLQENVRGWWKYKGLQNKKRAIWRALLFWLLSWSAWHRFVGNDQDVTSMEDDPKSLSPTRTSTPVPGSSFWVQLESASRPWPTFWWDVTRTTTAEVTLTDASRSLGWTTERLPSPRPLARHKLSGLAMGSCSLSSILQVPWNGFDRSP